MPIGRPIDPNCAHQQNLLKKRVKASVIERLRIDKEPFEYDDRNLGRLVVPGLLRKHAPEFFALVNTIRIKWTDKHISHQSTITKGWIVGSKKMDRQELRELKKKLGRPY